MLKEIGSNFWIHPNENLKIEKEITPEIFGVKGADYVWLSTGRSGIEIAVENIEKNHPNISKIAIVPPFTCETVITPFIKAGYKIIPYEINLDLSVNINDVYSLLKKTGASILIMHRYFGFETIHGNFEYFSKFRSEGGFIIEDRTQCLYSNIKPINADFWVASIRKWLGVPDGGFIVSRECEIYGKPKIFNKALELSKVEASRIKYDYIFNDKGEKKVFLKKYKIAEDILDEQNIAYSICPTSYAMQSNLNIDELKFKRRRNYKILSESLSLIKGICVVHKDLYENEVPLYCPIIVENRNIVQKGLRDNDIFAPIIWPKAEYMPKVCTNAENLYHKMLSIPVDQRYSDDDMCRIVECMKNIMNNSKSVI